MASTQSFRTFSHIPYIDAIRAAKIVPPGHPAEQVITQVLAAGAAQQAAAGIAPKLGVIDALNVENSLRLNPQDTLARNFRTVVLGGTVDPLTNIVTFSPQKDCVPLRMIVPDTDALLTFSAFESGLDQYLASNDPILGGFFNRKACAAYMRPILTRVGQDITIRASALPKGHGYAIIAADVSESGLLAPMGELRPLGVPKVALAAGAAGTIKVRPQKDFRVRKLSVAVVPAAPATADQTLTQFLVGVDPQFLSADEITLEAFDPTVPWEVWLDGDQAQIGQEITLSFQNYDAINAVDVYATIEGNVVR